LKVHISTNKWEEGENIKHFQTICIEMIIPVTLMNSAAPTVVQNSRLDTDVEDTGYIKELYTS